MHHTPSPASDAPSCAWAEGAGISAGTARCAHGEFPTRHSRSRASGEAIGDPAARAPRASGFPLTRAALAGMTSTHPHALGLVPSVIPEVEPQARLSGIQQHGRRAQLDSRSALRFASCAFGTTRE